MQWTRFLKLTLFLTVVVSLILILVKYPQRYINVANELVIHMCDQEVKQELILPKHEERNENDTIPDLKNFPWTFYNNGSGRKPKDIQRNCGQFPSIEDIHFNNIYWQRSIFDGVDFYLIGAYYDLRPKQSAVVRILVMANTLNLEVRTRCQLWFQNRGVLTDFSWYIYAWSKSWGYQTDSLYQPYIVSCEVPEQVNGEIPLSASLVGRNPCETATNNLHVEYNIGNRTKFGVCVKGLAFDEDISIKLAEWIELVHLLGASKIYIYNLGLPANVLRLLDYYDKKRHLVEVTKTSLPGKYPNIKHLQRWYLQKYKGVKRLIEVVQYNDCFYKNMYRHDYIAIVDVDEVIIPKQGDWNTLLSSIPERASFYYARNVYFFEDDNHKPFDRVPSYMHILRNVHRAKDFVGKGLHGKSFHSTRDVLTVHNHVPLQCIAKTGKCSSFEIDIGMAQMNHYRTTCVEEINDRECDQMKRNTVRDENIWRFKERLIARVNQTIKELDLL